MYISLHVKHSLFLPDFNELEFFRQIFKKYPNIKCQESPFSRSRIVPCGRTDRRQIDVTKIIVPFRNFANALKMVLM
jgi:hypothetical protein